MAPGAEYRQKGGVRLSPGASSETTSTLAGCMEVVVGRKKRRSKFLFPLRLYTPTLVHNDQCTRQPSKNRPPRPENVINRSENERTRQYCIRYKFHDV